MAESMNNYNGYAEKIEEMDWDEFEKISGNPYAKVEKICYHITRITCSCIDFCVKCYFFWMIGKIILGF